VVQTRRFNPDGNERLTAAIGLILLVGTAIELGTLVLGLQTFLSWHVFVGFVLLPPIALKLASTGWRFMRYYTRNEDYRVKGAPQTLMRLLAPLLVAFTVLLFGSGVAMGFAHGSALQLVRRIHGPAAFLWTVTVGVHVLMYIRRALRSTAADMMPRTRGEAAGATLRTFLVAGAIAGGLVVAIALLPDLHVWLHLPGRQD
jgi:phosphate/sulfate permease